MTIAGTRAAGAASPASTLRPFDANSMTAIRKVHAGKPFVLAFWSLYCEPCRDEMAVWNALRRKHPALPVLLVSTDAIAERAAIDEFFARYDAGAVERWIFADTFTERVRYAVDKRWRGELPRSYFFDAAHNAEIKSGRVDQAWVEDWLVRRNITSR